MDKNLERTLNTAAYILIIIVEIIYIYVTNNDLNDDDDKNSLVHLGRTILFITAIYFFINAFIGLSYEKNSSQYKQVVASFFALLTAFIRITIKDDNITFR